MSAYQRITGRGLVSVYSASSERDALSALTLDRCTSVRIPIASYARQGGLHMARRKAGAKPVYRLRRIAVVFEYDEDTSQAFDETDVIRWFKENEPEFRVLSVTFPEGSYWDEPPDPSVIPDKD